LIYEDKELADIGIIYPTKIESLPDKQKYIKYYVNDAFVEIIAKSQNATVYESRGPYQVIITVTGENDKNLSFVVHDLNISSSKGKIYLLGFSTPQEKVIIRPAENLYASMATNNEKYYYAHGTFSTDEYFSFQENRKEDIIITLIIQVISNIGSEKKKIEVKLSPVTKKGLFQPMFW
jgi:hypothetical protein